MNTNTRFLLFIVVILSVSCGKKRIYSGTVYSRHHIPMPNVSVGLHFGHGGRDATDASDYVTTDVNGNFTHTRRLRKNHFLGNIYVMTSDSGDCYKKFNSQKDVTNVEMILK